MLTPLNRAPEIKLHVKGALNDGVTVEAIKAALLHATVAVDLVRRALAEDRSLQTRHWSKPDSNPWSHCDRSWLRRLHKGPGMRRSLQHQHRSPPTAKDELNQRSPMKGFPSLDPQEPSLANDASVGAFSDDLGPAVERR
jgi:hypothetical protein